MGFKKTAAKRALPARLDEAKLLDYALKSLSVKAQTEKELRARLKRRAETASAIDVVMGKLREYGYVDDARFAEGYASARLESRGYGKQRVLRDLRARNVNAKKAEKAVAKVFEGTDETALVEQYLTRKFRGKVLPEYLADPKNLAAAFRRLRYAGFSSAASIQALRRHSEQADELEGADAEEPGTD